MNVVKKMNISIQRIPRVSAKFFLNPVKNAPNPLSSLLSPLFRHGTFGLSDERISFPSLSVFATLALFYVPFSFSSKYPDESRLDSES